MRAHPVFADMPVTVFEHMSGLARSLGAINLGQGFPDDAGPLDLRQAAAEALISGSNQYAPSRGLPELRQAVADHYRAFQGLEYEPQNVVVTSGATEAIAASILALVNEGDEVLIFEPAYDAYRPLVERAGAIARPIRLEPPLWRLDAAQIEAAVTPRTRVVLFNTPMNPVARVFDEADLAVLADVCVRHDLIVISDEVWEHIVFDGRRHLSLAAASGMADRTVKIGSAGKMFGMTGWKIGFACAPVALIEPIARAHQFLTFSSAPNLQSAVSLGLGWPQERFDAMRAGLQRSRDRLAGGLRDVGYSVDSGQGTYFLTLDLPGSGIELGDADFCDRIVRRHGVAAIPVSAFVSGGGQGRTVRLCFAKADAVLDQAVERLGVALHAIRQTAD